VELTTKLSGFFFTDKATSFIEMDEAGINIPRTVLINSENIASINSFFNYVNSSNCLLNHQNYSIRLSFSNIGYPHCIRDVAQKNNIRATVNNLINTARERSIDNYDIIFQPAVENIRYSGGIIKKDTSAFIEMVYGAGKTFFREGQYAYRYLCTETSEFESFGNQTLYTNWHNSNLIEDILSSKNILKDKLIDIARSIQYTKLTNNKLYEFAIVGNEVIFLESKNIIKGSYENLDRVFTDKEYLILDSQKKYDNVLVFDAPLFEHIDKLTNSSSVYVNGGAILSHLAFYCIQKSISCKIKIS